jgi:peptidoglycan hydrolase-like protein with peptidoglycan-binding domain
MKKCNILIVWFLLLSVLLIGCTKDKKQAAELFEPSTLDVEPIFMSDLPEESDKDAGIYLPPSGPYKPRNQEIQAALKNAGYYTGNIDGNIGPLTDRAIKDFQAANNLKADGKVGPQTWEILKRYLEPPSE